MRTHQARLITILTGEFHFPDPALHAVDRYARAIDLRACRVEPQRAGKTGKVDARILEFEAARPARGNAAITVVALPAPVSFADLVEPGNCSKRDLLAQRRHLHVFGNNR